MTDSELLQQFVRKADPRAFNEITRRHLDFVYAAARRYVNGDSHLAEDVTQEVFVDLARKAPGLFTHPSVAGWLYACTRFVALNTIRRDQRRLGREKEASLMTTEPPANPDWEKIRPVLDEALDELDERDREFVILRFFGQQPFSTIARQFAVTENAAQKAVARALDLLSTSLSRRGVTSTSAALTIALSQAAATTPGTLLASVTAAVTTATSGAAVSGVGTGMFAAAKLVAGLAIIAVVAGGTGFWVGRHRPTIVELPVARTEDGSTTIEIKKLEQRVRAEAVRADNAEADTATLLQAIAEAKDERLKALAAQRTVASKTAVTRPIMPYATRPGDSFAKIAQAYGLTLQALKAANPNVDPARLRVGQTLVLPPGAILQQPAVDAK